MKKLLSIITGMLFLFVVGFSSVAANGVAGFIDVEESHKNADAIRYLKENGIVEGYPDGTFKTEREVNRAEAVKIILLGSKIEAPEVFTEKQVGFPDVAPNQWYARYITKARNLGVVKGNPDGTFKPASTVNLAEALKILLITNKIDVSNIKVTTNPFADVPKDAWFAKYIQYAKHKNLIEPDKFNKVNPAQGMTRGTMAEVMYRLSYMNEKGLERFEGEFIEKANVETKNFTITAKQFEFVPNKIEVSQGDSVRLTIKSLDVDHGFSMPAFNVNRSLKSGTTEIIEFEATQKGEFPFVCSVYCGMGHAHMTGTLVVK